MISFLYFESQGDVARDRHHIKQAAARQVSNDYLEWLAIVQQQRGWEQGQARCLSICRWCSGGDAGRAGATLERTESAVRS